MKTPASRMALVLGIALALPPMAHSQQAEQAELETTLTRYELFFLQNFTVKVTSREISSLLNTQVAAITQKMGIPLQLTVDHIVADSRDGSISTTVALANMPPQMKEQMETQANALLRGTPLGAALNSLSFEALKKGIAFLRENKDRAELKNSSERYADFYLPGDGQTFGNGMTLSGILFRLDRPNSVIGAIKFTFDGNRSLLVKMAHQNTKLPEDGLYVPVLTQTAIAQTGITAGPGISLPPQVSIFYTDYAFHKSEQKTDAPW